MNLELEDEGRFDVRRWKLRSTHIANSQQPRGGGTCGLSLYINHLFQEVTTIRAATTVITSKHTHTLPSGIKECQMVLIRGKKRIRLCDYAI